MVEVPDRAPQEETGLMLSPVQRLALTVMLGREADRPVEDIGEDTGVLAALASHHMIGRTAVARVGGTDPALRDVALRQTQTSLKMMAELQRLRQNHLTPLGARYLVVKGLAVSARYYGDFTVRACRDIDILVSKQDMAPLLTRLLADGYRLVGEFSRLPTLQEEQQIQAMVRLCPEVAVRSPDGVLIEIHQRLDLSGQAFSTEMLLDRAESVAIAGQDWPVPSTADLFVYLCYHHTRHYWSRLSWLGDLSAVMNAPDFDRQKVLHRAEQAGLLTLVQACMALPECLRASLNGQEGPGRVSHGMPLTTELARYCLTFADPEIPPPESQEVSAWHSARWAYITLDWRIRDGLGNRLVTLRRLFRPGWREYQQWPLPQQWHGLYWLLRPVRAIVGNVRPRR